VTAPLTLRVAEWRQIAARARLLELDLGRAPYAYRAGQATWVGRHDQPSRKHYSIAAPPHDAADRDRLQLLILVDGAGSAGPHLERIGPGALVDVGPPRGAFVFPDEAAQREYLFVAGGAGIAPLRSMLLHARRARPDARLSLAYSARTPEDLAFADEFRAMAAGGALRFAETVTRSGLAEWTGRRGRITRDRLAALLGEPASTRCFVCGPPAMTDAARAMLEDLGVPADRVQREAGQDGPGSP
jgi:ferredoxin-NADP reductase